jgi:hypothetical protein
MNLTGYSKSFGEGPDAGPGAEIIERTRTYLQEAGLKEGVAYFDEPNMKVYVATGFGLFVVSSDDQQRYVGELTPWQDVSGCALRVGPTAATMRSMTVTIRAPEATLTERDGASAAPLLDFLRECVKRSRPW